MVVQRVEGGRPQGDRAAVESDGSAGFPVFRREWIAFEDEDLIVVRKPAGVPCQAPDPGGADDLVTRLRAHLALRDGCSPEQVYLGVHQRLDQETSGLLVYTRRPEANPSIAAQFSRREVEKEYIACVNGYPGGTTTLRHRLAKGRGGAQVVVSGSSGKLAVTHVAEERRVEDRSWLVLGCETGRTHQLRVQLAEYGAPIAGDRRYGGPAAPRLLLHARRLGLLHPRGERMRWTAPVPTAFDTWLSRGMPSELDGEAMAAALPTAVARRYRYWLAAQGPEPTTAFRLVHGEEDGLPGLTVDVYGAYLVANLFPGAFRGEQAVLAALGRLGFAGVYVKRHPRQKNALIDARGSELCPPEPVLGQAAPDPLWIKEYGVPLSVSLGDGLRTGLFLDQRENRRRVAELSLGKRLLNLFAYTGGFSAVALAGGAAEVVSVDVSGAALSRAHAQIEQLGHASLHRAITGDVFDVLPRLQRRGERFDVIVLDPPSYATTKRRRFRAIKDYPQLLAATLPLLAPQGHVLCCINHHQVSSAHFHGLILSGARLAGVALAHCRELRPPRDFPGQQPLFKTWLCRLA